VQQSFGGLIPLTPLTPGWLDKPVGGSGPFRTFTRTLNPLGLTINPVYEPPRLQATLGPKPRCRCAAGGAPIAAPLRPLSFAKAVALNLAKAETLNLAQAETLLTPNNP
jgi:hypothetical protein